MDYFGYDLSSFICCEICGKTANDIHHIENKKSGGSKLKDNIENLMALCRGHHIFYGDKKQYKEMLIQQHLKFMEKNGK
jgi:predicted restriction endonuclease